MVLIIIMAQLQNTTPKSDIIPKKNKSLLVHIAELSTAVVKLDIYKSY